MENKIGLHILNKEYEDMIYELAKGEGSTLTYAETIATIHNQKTSGRPRDIILVTNITNALTYVMDLIIEDKMFFDKQILCNINRYVSANENFDNIGGFRIGTIKVRGSKNKGVDPNKADEKFFEILHNFHSNEISNESIIKLCLTLCKEQFFGDGNKRTAQLMMNGLLVKHNQVPFVINFKEKENVDALLEFYDNNNEKPLYDIFIKKQQEIAKCYNISEKGWGARAGKEKEGLGR